jgi:hypothetical protein
MVASMLDLFEELQNGLGRRGRRWPWELGNITVVSPEGLIALKSLRGSGRDQDDIKQLRGEAE